MKCSQTQTIILSLSLSYISHTQGNTSHARLKRWALLYKPESASSFFNSQKFSLVFVIYFSSLAVNAARIFLPHFLMGKKGGTSWLTAVKRAFRSPTKDDDEKVCASLSLKNSTFFRFLICLTTSFNWVFFVFF